MTDKWTHKLRGDEQASDKIAWLAKKTGQETGKWMHDEGRNSEMRECRYSKASSSVVRKGGILEGIVYMRVPGAGKSPRCNVLSTSSGA